MEATSLFDPFVILQRRIALGPIFRYQQIMSTVVKILEKKDHIQSVLIFF